MNTFTISQRVFFLFLLLGLGACQQKNKDLDTNVSIEEIHVNDFDEHAIAYKDFVHAHHFVPLETTDSCLVGNVLAVEMTGERIFVLDDKDKLWVFDTDGKYVGRIGTQGPGPEEYSHANKFYVNESKGHIGILDLTSNRVFRYTLDNKFIDQIRFEFDLVCTGVVTVNNGETVLLLSSNSKQEKYNYAAYDESDFSLISYQIPFRILGEEGCSNPMLLAHNAGASSLALAMNSDTIYQWKENRLQPAFLVEGGLKHITAEALMEKTPHDCATAVGIRLAREDGYSMGVQELYATDRYWCLEYPSKDMTLFVDWKQGEKRMLRPEKATILSTFSFGATSTTNTSLIRCLSAEVMEFIKEDLKDNNHPEFHELYGRLTEDSNPVIGVLDYGKLFK